MTTAITSSVNKALFATGFSSSSNLNSSASQVALLSASVKTQVPNLQFSQDGKSESLTNILNTALSNNPDSNLLNSLNQVSSYKSSEALLNSAYGTKSTSINELI